MKSELTLLPAAMCALYAALVVFGGCSNAKEIEAEDVFGDTLKVATIYGPASFFSYRDTLMGYDYDFMEAIAADHGKTVRWIVAPSVDEAIAMADAGTVDIVAAPIPEKDAATIYKDKVTLCGPEMKVDEVLVQPAGDTVLVNIADLAGETIYVEKDSKSEANLRRINADLDGRINIVAVDADSIAVEDMLAEVASGERGPVATDRETALINKAYHPELRLTLSLSEPETTRWGVAFGKDKAALAVDTWCTGVEPEKERGDILSKYLDAQRVAPVAGAKFDFDLRNGYASPYDGLFKTHAEGSRWDWRLLAAQGFAESRFKPTAKSWAGASGLMQIMPATGRQFGLKKSEMFNPDRSIETAVKILDYYDNMMAKKVPDPQERIKFTLASYNAGAGHVLDAIKLAEKYGLDPTVWDDNVEKGMLMKMNKKYYRDPVVRHGYSRGRETVDYVDRIYAYYDQVRSRIPRGDTFETHPDLL